MTLEEDLKKQKEGTFQHTIGKYLIERAKTDANIGKCWKKKKRSLDGCLIFCSDKAKQLAKNGVAVLDNETVYGWAVDYVLDGPIGHIANEEETPKQAEEATKSEAMEEKPKPTPIKPIKPKKPVGRPKKEKPSLGEQLSLFGVENMRD